MRDGTAFASICFEPTETDLTIVESAYILILCCPIQSNVGGIIATSIVDNQDFPFAVAEICFVEKVDCLGQHCLDTRCFIIRRHHNRHNNFWTTRNHRES